MNKNITSRLEDAIIVFGRFLRQAGCPIGTGELMNAVCACAYIQISNREDFRQALKSTLISDYKLLDLFDQLFDCLLYTSPSPRDQRGSRMPSSA